MVRSMGAQWRSGRVLDSRPRGRGFELNRRHCVVVLESSLVLAQPRKARPCLTERLLMGGKESNQNKWYDQLLPQYLMNLFNTLLHDMDILNVCM